MSELSTKARIESASRVQYRSTIAFEKIEDCIGIFRAKEDVSYSHNGEVFHEKEKSELQSHA